MLVFTPLPDETPREFGSAVLSLYVRSTPLLDEAPGEIGVEFELDGITPDEAAGISGVVNVSSALGIGIAPAGSLRIPSTRLVFTFFLFS